MGASPTDAAPGHPQRSGRSAWRHCGACDGTPFRRSPVTGLPRLRTPTAAPGTLSDPLEVAGLTELEFLERGAHEWRVLLDAGAAPRTPKAAAIKVRSHDQLPVAALANEILTLRGRA
ncbi:hypothetical protein [Streptomyces erythrochromogenes]|uniref:hypothetical protein n=1 Tax=Streptomyces erythrochromogenes TaxID=285574 RepID=UPI0036978B37